MAENEMNAPDWYETWRHDAYHEMLAKQDGLKAEFKFGQWPRFDYDLDKETFVFSQDGRVMVSARVQVVGSVSKAAGNWLWGWGNDWWPEAVIRDARAARQFGEDHGISELTTAHLTDDNIENLGWEMTAVTMRVAGAMGAYRAPGENVHLFLVLHDLKYIQ
jgi:hypothetical protein